MPELARLVEKGVVTPPMKHVQEENITCSHHHRLEPFWKETLNSRDLAILRSAIPRSDPDPKEIPPGTIWMVRRLKDESLLNGPIYQKFPRRIGDS